MSTRLNLPKNTDSIEDELARQKTGRSVLNPDPEFGTGGDPANDPPEILTYRLESARTIGSLGAGAPTSKPSMKSHIPSKTQKDVEPKPMTNADPSSQSIIETDIGNGRRFVAIHGAAVRYVADMKLWFVWAGKRWEVDRSETLIEQLAKNTVNTMAHEAAMKIGGLAKALADTNDDQEKGNLNARLKRATAELSHAKKSADMRAIRRMSVKTCSSCPEEVFALGQYDIDSSARWCEERRSR